MHWISYEYMYSIVHTLHNSNYCFREIMLNLSSIGALRSISDPNVIKTVANLVENNRTGSTLVLYA